MKRGKTDVQTLKWQPFILNLSYGCCTPSPLGGRAEPYSPPAQAQKIQEQAAPKALHPLLGHPAPPSAPLNPNVQILCPTWGSAAGESLSRTPTARTTGTRRQPALCKAARWLWGAPALQPLDNCLQGQQEFSDHQFSPPVRREREALWGLPLQIFLYQTLLSGTRRTSTQKSKAADRPCCPHLLWGSGWEKHTLVTKGERAPLPSPLPRYGSPSSTCNCAPALLGS